MVRAWSVKHYASLARFGLLALIWGATAKYYTLYMDISIRGVILSILYVAGSILATAGLITRAGFALLFVALIAHGVAFNHTLSFAASPLAAIGAILPTGAFWSADRALMFRNVPPSYIPTSAEAALPLSLGRELTFAGLALLIICGPVWNHVLHHHNSHFFRSWDMYHNLGRNLVNFQFYIKSNNELVPLDYIKTVDYHGPREVARAGSKYNDILRRFKANGLDDVIKKVCKTVPDPSALRVKAQLAVVNDGWLPLFRGDEKICEMHGETLK